MHLVKGMWLHYAVISCANKYLEVDWLFIIAYELQEKDTDCDSKLPKLGKVNPSGVRLIQGGKLHMGMHF